MRKKTWATGVLIGATAVAAMATAAAVPAASAAASSTALKPPPVTILTDTAGNSGGDIFISPFGDSTTYANGAEILSPNGKKVVWFHQAPAGQEDADFRTQTYDGQPVLTFWQGTGLGGVSTGEDYIYNDHYKLIATIKAGNGYSADGHEFLITPWNTALIISYTTATANLTKIGGPADQTVINGIVQEINIKGSRVLFHGTAPTTCRTPERPAAARSRVRTVGLVPPERDKGGHQRRPSHRRPRHLDHLRGLTADRQVRMAARRQGQLVHGRRRPRARCSTAPARSSPGSTTPRRTATASTRSSTTTPQAPPTPDNILVDLPYSRAITVSSTTGPTSRP